MEVKVYVISRMETSLPYLTRTRDYYIPSWCSGEMIIMIMMMMMIVIMMLMYGKEWNQQASQLTLPSHTYTTLTIQIR